MYYLQNKHYFIVSLYSFLMKVIRNIIFFCCLSFERALKKPIAKLRVKRVLPYYNKCIYQFS